MKSINLLFLLLFILPAVSPYSNGAAFAQTPADIRSAPEGIATTNDVDFSPDGSKIATYTKEDFIAIWDIETGELVQRLPGQDGYISELDWSPDGRLLASASNNGTVVIWDLTTGGQIRMLGNFDTGRGRAYSGANEVEFSPDGRHIAAMRYEPSGLVVAWRVSDGAEVFRLTRSVNTYDVGWSDNGEIIYSLDGDGFLNGWSFPEMEQTLSKRLDDERLVDLDGARQGLIATGGTGDIVIVYDVRKDSILYRLDQGSFVNRTAVSTDDQRVASAGSDGYMYYWDLNTGELIYRRFAHNPIHYYVTFSPDLQYMATSGSDSNLRLWDPDTGNLVRTVSGR